MRSIFITLMLCCNFSFHYGHALKPAALSDEGMVKELTFGRDSSVDVNSSEQYQRKFSISLFTAYSLPFGSYQEDNLGGNVWADRLDNRFGRGEVNANANPGIYLQLDFLYQISKRIKLGIAYGYLNNSTDYESYRTISYGSSRGGRATVENVPSKVSNWEHHLMLLRGNYLLISGKRLTMDLTIGLGAISSTEPLFESSAVSGTIDQSELKSIPDHSLGFAHQYGFKWSYLISERVAPFFGFQFRFAEVSFQSEGYLRDGVETTYDEHLGHLQKIYTFDLGLGLRVLF